MTTSPGRFAGKSTFGSSQGSWFLTSVVKSNEPAHVAMSATVATKTEALHSLHPTGWDTANPNGQPALDQPERGPGLAHADR